MTEHEMLDACCQHGVPDPDMNCRECHWARIATLEEENNRLKDRAKMLVNCAERNSELEFTVTRLREALEEYGQHDIMCDLNDVPAKDGCSCGLWFLKTEEKNDAKS